MKTLIRETAFCKTHIRYVGQDQFNNWYPQCFAGHLDKEKCDIEITKTYDDDSQEVEADKKREQEDNEAFFWLHH